MSSLGVAIHRPLVVPLAHAPRARPRRVRVERYVVVPRRAGATRRNDASGGADVWVHARTRILCDPDLARQAKAILDESYRSIGGNATFRSASDLCSDEYDHIEMVLSDGELRAVKIAKTTPFGVKAVATATDGTEYARTLAKEKTRAWFKQPVHYGEVSGKVAALALRGGAPVVDDPGDVERVLGRHVRWHGSHPDGEFPGTRGWYTRTIGGHAHTKILIGRPNLARANGRCRIPATRRR